MSSSAFTQRSFAGGVLAPTLLRRADTTKFTAGLLRAENWYVTRSGELAKRQGTQYIAKAKLDGNAVLLVEFVFNDDDAYVLEFGDGYVRWIRDDEPLRETAAPSWADATTYALGTVVVNSGVHYACILAHDSDTDSEPGAGADAAVYWYALTSNILELPTPYTEDELFGTNGERPIAWRGVNDRLYLVHPNHKPRTLSRFDATRWAVELLEFVPPTPPPTGISLTPNGGIGGSAQTWRYKLTAIDSETGRESLPALGDEIAPIDAITFSADKDKVFIRLFGMAPPSDLVGTKVRIGNIPTTTLADGSEAPIPLTTEERELFEILRDREWPVAALVGTPTPALIEIEVDVSSIDLTGEIWEDYGFTLHRTYFEIGVTGTIGGNDYVAVDYTIPDGADEVYVYKDDQRADVFGFIAAGRGVTFEDRDIDPAYEETPPIYANPFIVAGDYPALVDVFKERLVIGSTDNDPARLWFSRTGDFFTFSRRSPLLDDDSFSITVTGGAQEIRGLVDIGPALLVLTDRQEIALRGDADGVLTPNTVNQDIGSRNGSARIRPLVANATALYVQARRDAVLDNEYALANDQYRGQDLTAFVAHLLAGRTVVAWAYSRVPDSQVFLVLDDGRMLVLTYVREQGIWAWTRYETGGTASQAADPIDNTKNTRDQITDVIVIPRGNEDAAFIAVTRTIGATPRTYIEKLPPRRAGVEDYDHRRDSRFVDSHGTIDGTNATTDTLSALAIGGGQGYDDGDLVTLLLRNSDGLTGPLEGPAFVATDADDMLGRRLHFTTDTGDEIEFETIIETFTDANNVIARLRNIRLNGTLVDSIPLDVQTLPTAAWVTMIRTVTTNVSHLNTENVHILADGIPVYGKKVSSGTVVLPDAAGIVHVGMPMCAEFETLPLDVAAPTSIVDLAKTLTWASLRVYDTRGLRARTPGTPPTTTSADPDPIALTTGNLELGVRNRNDPDGTVLIESPEPLPAMILGITRGIDVAPREGSR